MRVSTQVGGPEWFVGVVYFYLKSNLSSLINGSDEGSDSVPGDGESKTDRETENEQTRRFIWTLAGGEREPSFSLVGEGRGGGDSCVLCSGPRC